MLRNHHVGIETEDMCLPGENKMANMDLFPYLFSKALAKNERKQSPCEFTYVYLHVTLYTLYVPGHFTNSD